MSERTFSIASELRPSLVSAVYFMLLTGLAYPLLTTAVARLLFPHQSQGSLIEVDGRIIGTGLIGQPFTDPGHFHPRPSVVDYDAMAGYGSNLGPTNPVLIEKVAERVGAYRTANGLPESARVPVDAVTASASGLDPDISVANALIQAKRVAAHRNLPMDEVVQLVGASTTPRQLGLLGEPRVNVLQLNRALDARWSAPESLPTIQPDARP